MRNKRVDSAVTPMDSTMENRGVADQARNTIEQEPAPQPSMGKGPALALLLAGPALSLPNMLVIRTVIGTQKTIVFVGLVVVMSTVSGLIFGLLSS